MYAMFARANSFNGDLSSWDVSAVTDMGLMFYMATSFNGMIKDWDVSSVATFVKMFYGASSFSRNLCWSISHDADTYLMMEGTAGGCWNCCDPPTYSPTTTSPTFSPTVNPTEFPTGSRVLSTAILDDTNIQTAVNEW